MLPTACRDERQSDESSPQRGEEEGRHEREQQERTRHYAAKDADEGVGIVELHHDHRRHGEHQQLLPPEHTTIEVGAKSHGDGSDGNGDDGGDDGHHRKRHAALCYFVL